MLGRLPRFRCLLGFEIPLTASETVAAMWDWSHNVSQSQTSDLTPERRRFTEGASCNGLWDIQVIEFALRLRVFRETSPLKALG